MSNGNDTSSCGSTSSAILDLPIPKKTTTDSQIMLSLDARDHAYVVYDTLCNLMHSAIERFRELFPDDPSSWRTGFVQRFKDCLDNTGVGTAIFKYFAGKTTEYVKGMFLPMIVVPSLQYRYLVMLSQEHGIRITPDLQGVIQRKAKMCGKDNPYFLANLRIGPRPGTSCNSLQEKVENGHRWFCTVMEAMTMIDIFPTEMMRGVIVYCSGVSPGDRGSFPTHYISNSGKGWFIGKLSSVDKERISNPWKYALTFERRFEVAMEPPDAHIA